MLSVLVLCWHHDGNPLSKMNQEFGWKIDFNERDIVEIEKYLKLMKPLQQLFMRLNSDQSSTLHLVFPTLRVRIII